MNGRLIATAAIPFALLLSACVPWTVRPIERSDRSGAVTPAAYVDSIWETKLAPAINDAAADARVLLDALAASPQEALSRFGRGEDGPAWFIVRGRGVVTAVDTTSRVGLAHVDIAPYDGKPDLSLQIGPVLRGTSLRDAPGVVRFSDFVNQLQFADVANELNDRVLQRVLGAVETKTLPGCAVSFSGTLAAVREAPLREVVPVEFTVEGCP
jgi:predicted lipoprotein